MIAIAGRIILFLLGLLCFYEALTSAVSYIVVSDKIILEFVICGMVFMTASLAGDLSSVIGAAGFCIFVVLCAVVVTALEVSKNGYPSKFPVFAGWGECGLPVSARSAPVSGTSAASAEPTPPSAVKGEEGTRTEPDVPSTIKGNDDQYFAYQKTKHDLSKSPDDRVGLMTSYARKYPTGKHIGEAMALVEEARKKAKEEIEQRKFGNIKVRCFVALGNGQTIPVKGWVQLLGSNGSSGLAEVIKAVYADEDVKKWAANVGKFGGMLDQAYCFEHVGKAYAKRLAGWEVVGQSSLEDGVAVFSNLPVSKFSEYALYGTGMAGLNSVGICDAAWVEGGQTIEIKPRVSESFLVGSGDREFAKLVLWKPIGTR